MEKNTVLFHYSKIGPCTYFIFPLLSTKKEIRKENDSIIWNLVFENEDEVKKKNVRHFS